MPRQDTVTTTVYTFDELSEQAKEKARDNYRTGNLDYDWWDSVYEMADTAGKCLGIEINAKGKNTPAIYFSGFCSQGDGACFEGQYAYRKGWRSALLHEFGPGETLTELLSIGQALQEAQAPHFYKLKATTYQRGHYQHSGCMHVDVVHNEHRYRDLLDAEDDVRDTLRLFADWIYNRLEGEHDYLQSNECIDVALGDGMEFTEDGSAY